MATDDRRQRAVDLLLRGDTAGAITDLKALLADEPEDDEAWLAIGMAYEAVGHAAEALHAFARSVALDGEVVAARVAYARALVKKGKLDDAAFQLLQAAKIDPTDAHVLGELGLVFYDKRLFEKAALWLGRAAAAAPDDARVAYALGLAHEGRRDVGAAIAAYREAVRRSPSLVDARKTLADALASTGEHQAAIDELEAVLAIERSNEQVAHNRDVLVRVLADMREHRLLGKGEREVEASALVQEGQLRRKGPVPATIEGTQQMRWSSPLAELWVTHAPDGSVPQLMLVIPDPARAAKAEDDTFKVTVIATDGNRTAVNYATAVTLTFLREALGCPMTRASELYARLLGGEAVVEWGGATLAFATVPRPDKPSEERHGLVASLRAP